MEEDGPSGNSSGMGPWKQNLYLLQERAPKPKAVLCKHHIENRPRHYGNEFHGLIDRTEAERMLLEAGEGAYLVRESTRSKDAYTLCMVFDKKVLNYKLYYDGAYYVGEKRFDTMDLLVADGLISMYVDLHASDYIKRMADEAIYEDSPYSRYTSATTDIARRPVTRAHNFVPYTFKAPHYCDYCRNFLWGLVHQGQRCEDCGFAAHKKCSEKTLHDCRPEAKYVKRMFSVDITTLCLAHGTDIPPVVTQCIAEVERRGLHVEGIYRVSGSYEHIEKLRLQYDANQSVDLSAVADIHTVCGLLKSYFRLLPQQLIPFSVHKELLAVYTETSMRPVHDRIRAIRKAMLELSDANIITLGAILSHLKKVAENSAKNKMTVENLATIFSPTLFCSGAIPAMPNHQLLHFLISNPQSLTPCITGRIEEEGEDEEEYEQNYEIQRPERPGETSSNHGSRRTSACTADDEDDFGPIEEVDEEPVIRNGFNGNTQPSTDRYGFFLNRAGGFLQEHAIEPERLRKREKKWIQMLDNWRYFMDERFEVIRNRCRKGIPPSLRGRAWKYLCGAMYQMEVSSNRFVFEYCVKQAGDPKWIDDIQKDLNRQFPEHEMFAREGKYGDGGKDDLFNLLKAWTVLHPEEGYCQGQAPVAAVLLMHMPVRDAFYCFVQICHKYLPGYYSAGLEAVQVDGDILNKLLKEKSKLTYKHFKKNNVDPILYMVEWFMCIFCRSLPWPTVLRVWDMFLCEGVKILFKVALVLLKYGIGTPKQIKDYPDLHSIVTRLKNLPPMITSEEFLVEKVCEMTLNDADLEKFHFTAMKLRQMRFS
ncbi:unnamed protein product [Caenorhabditis bovis]|uniref:Uncharacterized protein n=1 Tax=Caenorhabditis bovis TaxID=2654633 RepID=A0A8S1ERY2_9PELO|nr:unnamed protein product [Caenorhabditis bovis]